MGEFTGERLIPGEVGADLYNEHFSRYRFAANLIRGKRVLDAGCGVGYGSECLAEYASAVIGVDQHPQSVAGANRQYANEKLGFIASDVQNLPFADHYFECSVSFEVIEHLRNPLALLQSLKRVTQPSGLVILSTPNRDVYKLSRGDAGPNPFHHHEFSLDEFTALLGQCFPHIKIFAQNHTPTITFRQRHSSLPPGIMLPPEEDAGDSAQFYVAICSGQPIPDLADAIFVADNGNVLFERESHIRLLTEELRLKTSWLDGTQNSLTELHQAHEALREEHNRRSEWALQTVGDLESTNKDLAAQLASKCDELQLAVDRLNEAERTIVERSEWARRLDKELLELRDAHNNLEAAYQTRSQEAIELRSTLSAVEGPHQEMLIRYAQLKNAFATELHHLANLAGLETPGLHAGQPRSAGTQSIGRESDFDQELEHAKSLAPALRNQVRVHAFHSREHTLARNSRWVKLGRLLGIGPRFTEHPKEP